MADALSSSASCCMARVSPHESREKLKAAPFWCTPGKLSGRASAVRPMCAVASFNDFAASSFPGGAGGAKRRTHTERDFEQSEQQLREFLRGGEDVASIMSQMANLLEDIQGFEDREEALAVEMAAAAAVAGRLEILDRNFLLALDYMMHEASKIRDDKQVWLLQTLKQQVLVQLESRFPPQVEVVSLLVTTPKREERLDILRRAAAAASYGANKAKLDQHTDKPPRAGRKQTKQGFSTQRLSATEATPAGKEVTPPLKPEQQVLPMAHQRLSSAETLSLQEPGSSGTINGTTRYAGDEDPESVSAAAAWWEESKREGGEGEGEGEAEEEASKVKRKVPAATLQNIIAQADDLIAFMEEELPIRDRRLLARLVLAREEARAMMSGGFLDPRNDVRKLQNLPEPEVRFISQLAAIRVPQQLRQRLLQVLRGEGEGEHLPPAEDGKSRLPYGAPVRPGHFMDSVTKVIAGIYKTGGSGVVVQQLERIRKESLEVLQDIGHS